MKQKYPIVYAFIDSQNLNLGTLKDLYKHKQKIYQGWHLDFKKFRQYLADKFHVQKAFLFIGYLKEYESLYGHLKSSGYQLIFKPTVKDEKGVPKGNVDAELVLYSCAIEYTNYDQAIIVSGDGDFYCLLDFLKKKNKLKGVVIPNKYSESSLLKPFQNYKHFLNPEKNKLEYKKP